jgi:hypothetical protein
MSAKTAPDSEWPFNVSHSPGDIPMMRADAIRRAALHGRAIEKFTCDECPDKCGCDLVFDSYNTDGDCLASK